jgi:hypothetical protein
MSEVIEAYEACKATREVRAQAENDEKKRCADFESALKIAYPQYRILHKVLAKLGDALTEAEKWRFDHDSYGIMQAMSVVRREIELCKKDILEVENITLADKEVIDWQERDR